MNAPAPIGQKDRTLTRIDAVIAHLTALRLDTARTGFAWDSEHMLGAIDAAAELFEGDDLNEARQCAVDSLGEDSDYRDAEREAEYADYRSDMLDDYFDGLSVDRLLVRRELAA